MSKYYKILAERVFKRLSISNPKENLDQNLIEKIIMSTMEKIMDELVKDRPVTILGFGTFSPKINQTTSRRRFVSANVETKKVKFYINQTLKNLVDERKELYNNKDQQNSKEKKPNKKKIDPAVDK